MTRLEAEFCSMLGEFENYGERDVASLGDARYRALYEGVAAGSREPAVARAFMIVFNDMIPIRIAGRMIFKHLKSVMGEHIRARRAEEESIVSSTGLSTDEIDAGRATFMALVDDGTTSLTINQLVDSGIVETAVELWGFDDFDAFLAFMERDEKGLLDFEQFMIGLQKCAEGSCAPECTVPEVLSEVALRMEPIEEQKRNSTANERKQKNGERYDGMVASFAEWEDRVPTDEGRMLDVLRGSFVGAKNDKVVNALKIVYMDYSALRVGGDLVFKVMKKLVAPKKT